MSIEIFPTNASDGSLLWQGSLLLVDKPKTWTSFDVVNKIRYALKLPKQKLKVGHAGTLDPLATGLLLICTGKFTKKINELQGLDKVYDGIFELGATTPSYDAETEIDQQFPLENVTNEAINNAAKSFIGLQEQVPPIYSAIKVDGQRAYKYAREGQQVELKKRSIELFDFIINDIDLPKVHFEVHCTKGTYIRSLAYDFGRKLNNGAYLHTLRRTKTGAYHLDDAWELDQLIAFINHQREILFGYSR